MINWLDSVTVIINATENPAREASDLREVWIRCPRKVYSPEGRREMGKKLENMHFMPKSYASLLVQAIAPTLMK